MRIFRDDGSTWRVGVLYVLLHLQVRRPFDNQRCQFVLLVNLNESANQHAEVGWLSWQANDSISRYIRKLPQGIVYFCD